MLITLLAVNIASPTETYRAIFTAVSTLSCIYVSLLVFDVHTLKMCILLLVLTTNTILWLGRPRSRA